MKNIKTFLIGFLTCTCMFLFMGQSDLSDTQVGRYQIEVLYDHNVLETEDVKIDDYNYFLLDTKVGKIVEQGNILKYTLIPDVKPSYSFDIFKSNIEVIKGDYIKR